jgi:hypothetical protein
MAASPFSDLLAACIDHEDGMRGKVISALESGARICDQLAVDIINAVRRRVVDVESLQGVCKELADVLQVQSIVQYLLERLQRWNIRDTLHKKTTPDVETQNEEFFHLVQVYVCLFCALSSCDKKSVSTVELQLVEEMAKMVLEKCLPPEMGNNDKENEKMIVVYRTQTKGFVDLTYWTFKFLSQVTLVNIKQVIQPMAPQLLLILGVNWRSHEWTDTKTVSLIHKLSELLVQLSDLQTINQLLCGKLGKSGHLGEFLKLLRLYLKKETLEHAQMAISAFHWCLKRVHHPNMASHLPSLTPPLLLMIDTYDTKIKSTGLRCIARVISEVDPSELRLYDRAEVIYAALQPQIYNTDPRILCNLYPPLLGIIQVLEPLQQRARQVAKRGRLDHVFSLILSLALCESKIALRRAHASCLHQFVTALGIGTCKHLKRLLDLIFDYFEFPDGESEETRLSALQALEVVIRETWPRMPCHATEIAKKIIRLIVDCSKGQTADKINAKQGSFPCNVTIEYFGAFTDSDTKSGILLGSCKCLVLLLRCGGDKFRDELKAVQMTEEHSAVACVVDAAYHLL